MSSTTTKFSNDQKTKTVTEYRHDPNKCTGDSYYTHTRKDVCSDPYSAGKCLTTETIGKSTGKCQKLDSNNSQPARVVNSKTTSIQETDAVYREVESER